MSVTETTIAHDMPALLERDSGATLGFDFSEADPANVPWYESEVDNIVDNLGPGVSSELGSHLVELQFYALGVGYDAPESLQGIARATYYELLKKPLHTTAPTSIQQGELARVDAAVEMRASAMVSRLQADWDNGKYDRILCHNGAWVYNAAVDVELTKDEWPLKQMGDRLYRLPCFRLSPRQDAKGEYVPFCDGEEVIALPDPTLCIESLERGDLSEQDLRHIFAAHDQARLKAGSNQYIRRMRLPAKRQQ